MNVSDLGMRDAWGQTLVPFDLNEFGKATHVGWGIFLEAQPCPHPKRSGHSVLSFETPINLRPYGLAYSGQIRQSNSWEGVFLGVSHLPTPI